MSEYLIKSCYLAVLTICISGCSTFLPKVVTTGQIIQARNEIGVSGRVRIDSVESDPKDPTGDIYLYSVSVEDEGTHSWVPYCAADSEQIAKAIPLSGYWDTQGKYHLSDSIITLACTSGVIAKCVRWGYAPWKQFKGHSLQDLHLACVRMARADYCGDGIGHTRDGTPIDLFDVVGIQEREQGTMQFEAAWSPEGATCINHTRWADLENVLKECPDKLKGRTSHDGIPLTPDECRERWPETLIFNDSYLRAQPFLQ